MKTLLHLLLWTVVFAAATWQAIYLEISPETVYHGLMAGFWLVIAAIGFTVMYRKSIELWLLRRRAKKQIQSLGTKTNNRYNLGKLGILLLVSAYPAFSQTTEEVPLTVLPHQILLVDAELNGRPVRLVVDTGASQTIIDNDVVGIPVTEINRVAAQMRQGPGRFRSVTVEARSLRLGRNNILYPKVSVAELKDISKLLHTEVHGVLGADVLSRFDEVTINWKKKVLRLTY